MRYKGRHESFGTYTKGLFEAWERYGHLRKMLISKKRKYLYGRIMQYSCRNDRVRKHGLKGPHTAEKRCHMKTITQKLFEGIGWVIEKRGKHLEFNVRTEHSSRRNQTFFQSVEMDEGDGLQAQRKMNSDFVRCEKEERMGGNEIMGTTLTKVKSIRHGTGRIECKEMRIVETESFVRRRIEDNLDGTNLECSSQEGVMHDQESQDKVID